MRCKIEKYLSGEFSPDELEALEMHMQLDEIHNRLYNKKVIWLQRVSIITRYAAAVVFILLFVRARYIDTVKYAQLEDEQLLEQYFNDKEQIKALYRAPYAADYYMIMHTEYCLNREMFTEAKQYLESALEIAPEKRALLFYIGMCDFRAGDYQGAIEIWKEFVKEETPFAEITEYYLAGGYLLNKDTHMARYTLFSIIEKQNHYYKQLAQELLIYMN